MFHFKFPGEENPIPEFPFWFSTQTIGYQTREIYFYRATSLHYKFIQPGVHIGSFSSPETWRNYINACVCMRQYNVNACLGVDWYSCVDENGVVDISKAIKTSKFIDDYWSIEIEGELIPTELQSALNERFEYTKGMMLIDKIDEI